jgi:hypothetical protein
LNFWGGRLLEGGVYYSFYGTFKKLSVRKHPVKTTLNTAQQTRHKNQPENNKYFCLSNKNSPMTVKQFHMYTPGFQKRTRGINLEKNHMLP